MTTAIWWIRRDMRLADNAALAAAMEAGDRVLPVFVLDPQLLEEHKASVKRIAFMLGGLRSLDSSLRERGSRLLLLRGDPAPQLRGLAMSAGATVVTAEEDYTSYAKRRDAAVAAQLPLQLVPGTTVVQPGRVVKPDGTPYVVFTPFSKAWKAILPPGRADLLPAPSQLVTPSEPAGLPIPAEPALPAGVPFAPGEAQALRALEDFAGETAPAQPGGRGIFGYAALRHRLDLDATSGLSSYLRFGMVSARRAVVDAYGAMERAPDARQRKAAETWLDELIWREFYFHVLDWFPNAADESFRADLRKVEWSDDASAFESWRLGRTGYPVVDAAMRQLRATGWVHNRSRMIVDSFLVKDLLVDWRWGERHFMEHLLDGDPPSNNGGWQWSAGTGTDAAPFFRVFNPVLQGRKCDPDGVFARRWLPELEGVPRKHVHSPWEMSRSEEAASGCAIGRDYPPPIVDHAAARLRALAAYDAARKSHAEGNRGDGRGL